MNKLLTYNGGQPIFLDDFNFMQAATSEAQKLIVKGILGVSADYSPGVILSGFEKSSDGTTYYGGEIYIKGEIYHVDDYSIGSSEDVPQYCNIVRESQAPRKLKNGQTVFVHQVNKAELGVTYSGEGVMLLACDRLEAILSKRLAEKLATVDLPKEDMTGLSNKLTSNNTFKSSVNTFVENNLKTVGKISQSPSSESLQVSIAKLPAGNLIIRGTVTKKGSDVSGTTYTTTINTDSRTGIWPIVLAASDDLACATLTLNGSSVSVSKILPFTPSTKDVTYTFTIMLDRIS